MTMVAQRGIICQILKLKTMLLLILFLVKSICLIFGYKSFSIPKEKIKLNLFYLSYLLKCLYILISFIVFNVRLKKIIQILTEIESRLNTRDKKTMKCISKVFLIFWLILIIINDSIFVYLRTISQYSWDSIVAEFLWGPIALGYLFSTYLLLIMISFGIHCIETNTFKNFLDLNHETHGKMNDSGQRISDLQKNILVIQRLKQTVNSLFGYLPLFWFSQSFLSTCCRLTQFAINTQ